MLCQDKSDRTGQDHPDLQIGNVMVKTEASPPATADRQLDSFERYLSLWVALCMGAGVIAGKTAPAVIQAIRGLEFSPGSQINVPIALLIWLMITPMIMKVD